MTQHADRRPRGTAGWRGRRRTTRRTTTLGRREQRLRASRASAPRQQREETSAASSDRCRRAAGSEPDARPERRAAAAARSRSCRRARSSRPQPISVSSDATSACSLQRSARPAAGTRRRRRRARTADRASPNGTPLKKLSHVSQLLATPRGRAAAPTTAADRQRDAARAGRLRPRSAGRPRRCRATICGRRSVAPRDAEIDVEERERRRRTWPRRRAPAR